jgi:hypothetical protein
LCCREELYISRADALDSMAWRTAMNPHYRSAAPMILFNRAAVHAWVLSR